MFEDYKDDVAFYIVYIREAHAVDSPWPMEFQSSTGDVILDPVSDAERAKVAGQCVADLELPMPALVDGVDDRVGGLYRGWPDRLFLVGTDGRIAYAGGRGPFFFDVDGMVEAIKAELTSSQTKPSEPGVSTTGDAKGESSKRGVDR